MIKALFCRGVGQAELNSKNSTEPLLCFRLVDFLVVAVWVRFGVLIRITRKKSNPDNAEDSVGVQTLKFFIYA